MVFESLLKPSETKSIRVRPLKLVITIMREPAKGDIDSSHIIDSFEALYIGTALSIDSAAAGAAAFASGSGAILLAPFVAFFNTLFIIAGILLGSRITISSKRFSLLPGILLIAVGVFHLFS
ncbi:MAG: hypothetical protein Q8882_02355 [Bacillota bacterium]|nr:hypothetical protein [Bacillota bacterium]